MQKEEGPHPYPHKFNVEISLGEFIEHYSYLKEGEIFQDKPVSIAGQQLEVWPATLIEQSSLHMDIVWLCCNLGAVNHQVVPPQQLQMQCITPLVSYIECPVLFGNQKSIIIVVLKV